MVTPDATHATPPPARAAVLCIDDDPLVLHFYRVFLEARGYRVRTAQDGLAGLALAREDRPDVMLLDVMLRGLSGFDICRRAQADAALREIPIILLTVWDRASVEATGREAGAARTLQKPADPETIVRAIAEVVPPAGGDGGATPCSPRPPRP